MVNLKVLLRILKSICFICVLLIFILFGKLFLICVEKIILVFCVIFKNCDVIFFIKVLMLVVLMFKLMSYF